MMATKKKAATPVGGGPGSQLELERMQAELQDWKALAEALRGECVAKDERLADLADIELHRRLELDDIEKALAPALRPGEEDLLPHFVVARVVADLQALTSGPGWRATCSEPGCLNPPGPDGVCGAVHPRQTGAV